MFKKKLVTMMPSAEHKPLNGVHISKVAKL
jgi:hypothetical protein